MTVKKVDRAPLLNDIAEGAELKKTETVDKSGPAIDPGTCQVLRSCGGAATHTAQM